MKFLKLPAFKNSGKMFSRLERETILVWGVMLVFVGAVLLIIWSGYLFYSTVINFKRPEKVVKKIVVIDPEEIAEVIRLLDERQQKFEEILERQ